MPRASERVTLPDPRSGGGELEVKKQKITSPCRATLKKPELGALLGICDVKLLAAGATRALGSLRGRRVENVSGQPNHAKGYLLIDPTS